MQIAISLRVGNKPPGNGEQAQSHNWTRANIHLLNSPLQVGNIYLLDYNAICR